MSQKKKWQKRKSLPESDFVLEGIHPMIARLLYLRGINDRSLAERFLQPDYENLFDPYILPDMEKAVERIIKAFEKQEKVVVYADYDADAVTAAAVLIRFLREVGLKYVEYYIPDRFSEGYGVNSEAIHEIANQGVGLIVSVDTGITAFEPAETAKTLGIDFIITDHHKVVNDIPDAYAVVNPQRLGQDHELTCLTGVGVAFKLVQALINTGKFNITEGWEKWLLDLVAIGTIADMQDLMGENRILVNWGMHVLQKTRWAGLQALMSQANVDPEAINTYTVGFYIAPRINAAGRIDHAGIALDLLLTDDQNEAARLAGKLDKLNAKRQDLTEQIYSEAQEQALTQVDQSILITRGEGWHKGILGLVAGRLTAEFNKPAIVATVENGKIDGSARSVSEFDITLALGKAKESLEKFGGHKLAAGFSLKEECWDDFTKILRVEADDYFSENPSEMIIKYDLDIDFLDIDETIMDLLERFEPHGIANPRPKFRTDDVVISSYRTVGQDNSHLKLDLQKKQAQLPGIGFGFGYLADKINSNDRINVLYELQYNEWNGRKNIQVKIIDIKIL